MGVTDFDTKVAVVVRDDLAPWRRLNVCAFLTSGVVAGAGERVVGEGYVDAHERHYLPMLVQPVLVSRPARGRLHRRPVLHGRDEDNRAAVRAVPTAELDLVGLALRAPHKAVDAVVRGLKRHP